MENPSFRRFAEAISARDDATAARYLVHLLDLVPSAAAGAVMHFRQGVEREGVAFMRRASGLRRAVLSGVQSDVDQLLEECFGLMGDQAWAAHAHLRCLYVAHALN